MEAKFKAEEDSEDEKSSNVASSDEDAKSLTISLHKSTKRLDFSEVDTTLFDDNNWVSYQMAHYIKCKDEQLDMLYSIFRSCSFEDVCDGIRDRKNAEAEAIKIKQLEERLAAYYSTRIQTNISRRDRTNIKIKAGKKEIEEQQEKVEDIEKAILKLEKLRSTLEDDNGEEVVEELKDQIREEKKKIKNEIAEIDNDIAEAKEEYSEKQKKFKKKID